MIKRLFKWIKNIITAVLIVIIALVLIFSLKSSLTKEEIPELFGYSPMTVLTGSMSPAIKPGDVIVVNERDKSNIKKGDIITFKGNGSMIVTHRVIEVVKENGKLSFKTQGDANNTPDSELVTSEDVVGSLAFRLPGFGYVLGFLRTPVGIAVCAAFFIIVIFSDEVKNQPAKKENTEAADKR